MHRYDVLEMFGQGTFGRLYRVRRKSDDLVLVLKQIPFDGIPQTEQEEALNEASVMRQIDHPSFIRYYESFIENGHLNIVMEHASHGDLAKAIKAQNGRPFDEDRIWHYLIPICLGLRYLHEKRILHRDLKPQNIFLDENDRIKIGDLGLGRILGSKTAHARTGVGTPLYFSPELCEDKPYDDKSDVWALGCLMYELTTFAPPFLATNQIALAKKICAEKPHPLPETYSTELRFLIMKMLEKDVTRRPDMNQILNYSPMRIRLGEMRLEEREIQMEQHWKQVEEHWRIEMEQKEKEWKQALDSAQHAHTESQPYVK